MPFVYSDYWDTWSRRIGENPNGSVVEIDLMPIPCSFQKWKEIAKIRVRAHRTADSGPITEVLPMKVLQAMEKNLGKDLTRRLLTEDFLPQIDWTLYAQYCNGGANLEDIRL